MSDRKVVAFTVEEHEGELWVTSVHLNPKSAGWFARPGEKIVFAHSDILPSSTQVYMAKDAETVPDDGWFYS